MSTSGSVLSESVEQVAVVRLNRPDKLNALSQAMMIELVELFDSLSSDDSVRVVLLTAAGSRGFCAGRDLSELAGSVQAAIERPMQGPIRNVFEVILECRKPTVAAIFGHTLGGGAELALACDIRIAAEGLQFGFPVRTDGQGGWTVVEGLSHDAFATDRIKVTTDELLAERNDEESLLP